MRNRKYFFAALLLLHAFFSVAQQRPNIILIMADDMGFSDIGSYGGEVRTPNLDRLASAGLRYKQFYNAARCCPTRAALMTGLYPHQAGMGWMAAANLGTPAYQGNLNNNSVTIAEVLKETGYATCMTGKWHLTNERKIDGMVVDSWPRQRGFDRYFGIIPGGSNYFTPQIYSDNKRYPAPEDFYLTNAISDSSVRYLDEHFKKQQAQPIFMYVAYTSPHWPLHALQKDIDKYRDRYLMGWDKLREERFNKQKQIGLFPASSQMSERDKAVQAWDSLSPEEQQEMAMRMAIYAAQIDAMDQGIGRIIQKLEDKKQLDNTLIFFLSDNGACAEFVSSGESKEVNGKDNTWESYRINWANVSSTPFKEFKHYTFEGGIATPLIVHWPRGIEKKMNNQWVNHYGFLSDIMATCLDVSGAKYPSVFKGNKIVPLQGKSLRPHFSGKSNNRGIIFWEHEANLAVRDGKWKLVAKTPEDHKLSESSLELYDMDSDPIEMNNLANSDPERVKKMYKTWQEWATKVGAFPLDTREYSFRAREYRKKVNGSFDDLLGGWNINVSDSSTGSITIDSSGRISGKNAAKITVNETGARPAVLSMTWRFFPKKGEKYSVKLRTTAGSEGSFQLRVEKPKDGESRLLNETINTKASIQLYSSGIFEVQENGPLQIGLYYGKLPKGTVVWIDDVELVPIK